MSCRNYPHPSLSPVLSFPAASSAKTNPTETSLQTNKTEAEQSREPGFHTGFSESRAPTRGSLSVVRCHHALFHDDLQIYITFCYYKISSLLFTDI